MCAMAKRMEAACLRPLDTQERVQCESILDGRVPDLPPASEKLPPVADLLAPKGVNAPTMPDAKVAADPGFQRMCAQAETNFNTCATRRQHMTTYGSGGLGSDGQADAFYQCQKIYQGVLNMCHATKVVAAKTAPNAPVATPPKAPPPQQQAKGTPPQASSMPPAQPQPQPMSAKCQQLVSNYVAAAQANDGPRALAGYNALKSAGGCNVLDKVDRAPPPAQPSGGDSRFIARGARPNTAAAIGACDRSADGCAEAMRQLEQAASPAAQAAMIMNAVQVGLELGAAMASGLAATMPQGGGGGGTNYNSIGNRPAARTYGQGSAQPAPHVPQQPPVSCGSGPVCTAR
jgi:hypothetical protein